MSKRLKEINFDKIIEEYGDLTSFYDKLDSLIQKLKGLEKRTIADIAIYYRNLFSLENMSLEEDVIELNSVATKNISILEGIKPKSKVSTFIAELIKHNLEFMAK